MAKLNAKNVIWLWPSTKKLTEAEKMLRGLTFKMKTRTDCLPRTISTECM